MKNIPLSRSKEKLPSLFFSSLLSLKAKQETKDTNNKRKTDKAEGKCLVNGKKSKKMKKRKKVRERKREGRKGGRQGRIGREGRVAWTDRRTATSVRSDDSSSSSSSTGENGGGWNPEWGEDGGGSLNRGGRK